MFLRQFLFFVFLIIFLTACVGRKKYRETIQTLENSHQQELRQKTTIWTGQLTEARDSITRMSYQLAERKGENNALVAMQDKLENRIETLKKELENKGSLFQSNQESLSQELEDKQTEINRLKGLLDKVNAELDKNMTALGSLANDLRVALSIFPSNEYEVETSSIRIRVALSEELLFRSGSVSTVSKEASAVLERVSEVLQKYPGMNVMVTGHTDNLPPKNKGYVDNWNVSVVRAAIVARMMTEEHNLNPNQVLAAGKAEYAPRASNETAEGRTANRRIELVIQPLTDDINRAIKGITEKK